MIDPDRKNRPVTARRQRGVAAVELALVLPVMLMLLTFPLFYARCFWHYTVAQKAAQDAVRYLSQVSRPEMMSKKLSANAAAIAIDIAQRELAELAPGAAIDTPTATCDDLPCGTQAGRVPSTVRMWINFGMFDNFGLVETGRYGLQITADARMPYVGI